MNLIKQDVGVWIKCSDDLPDEDGLYLIVHNPPSGRGRHEMYFKTEDKKWYWQPNPYSVCGNGFITEWLKPIKQVYVLTDTQIEEMLVKFLDANVRAHLENKEVTTEQFLNSITNK